MKIKTLHAHFLISIGNYSNERIGFSVELEEGEAVEDVVTKLREQAKQIVGRPADDLYSQKWSLESEIRILTKKLHSVQEEWNRTADFLVAQGINPTAQKLSPVSGLLSASSIEEEATSVGEEADYYGEIVAP